MMSIRVLTGLFFAAAVAVTPTTAMAFADLPKIGDEAPSDYLSGITWLREMSEEGPTADDKPVVVEFWASWCAPCKRAIPHLTKLQSRYGPDQLSIIGVTWPDDRQTADDIKRFVQRQGKRMNYWVGLDESSKSGRELFKISRIPIPFAFIIGSEGRLQYLGHPQNAKFEDVLDKVVRGRYDHKSFEKAKRHLSEIKRARAIKNWEQYYKLSGQVLEIDSKIFYTIYLDRFDIELMDRNNPEKAYADARALIVERTDDPEMLSWLAEHIAENPNIPDEKRNLDVALELVEAARKAGGMSDPSLMSSEARIRLARGELVQAVDLQRNAYFAAPTSRKDQYKRTLLDYKSQLEREAE